MATYDEDIDVMLTDCCVMTNSLVHSDESEGRDPTASRHSIATSKPGPRSGPQYPSAGPFQTTSLC